MARRRPSWPGHRRLLKLFDAGYLERFRPLARRGSYPWTYHLGAEGHRLLQHAGLIARRERYHPRDLRLRPRPPRAPAQRLGARLPPRRRGRPARLARRDSTSTPPPEARRPQLRLDDDWSAEDLRDPRARLLRPDAVLEIAPRQRRPPRTVPRRVRPHPTRRQELRQVPPLRHLPVLVVAPHPIRRPRQPPFVLFVCQDEAQRAQFLTAADRELTGHRWHPSARSRTPRLRRPATNPLRARARRPRRPARGLATPRVSPWASRANRGCAPRTTRWTRRSAIRRHRRTGIRTQRTRPHDRNSQRALDDRPNGVSPAACADRGMC